MLEFTLDKLSVLSVSIRPLDQPSTWWLHPGMELDEPGGIWGKGGHPGEEE